jgi:sulfite exporter TauE/SafE
MGILGGVHCIGMCGGVASALAMRQPGHLFADLMVYNLGRISSYSVGGAVVGFVGQAGFLYQGMLPVQTVLLAFSNLLLILVGAYLAGWSRAILKLERLGAAAWSWARDLSGAGSGVSSSPYLLGVAWGWLPCGLVYSAFALALMSGSSVRGAYVMGAFGIGTIPSLLLAGFAASTMRQRFQIPAVRVLAGSLVIGFGLWGLVRVPDLGEVIRSGILCLT